MTTVRLGDVVAMVEEEARKAGIDPVLARGLLIAENSARGEYNPDRLISTNTASPAGAKGVGQVLPTTQQGLIKDGYLPADFKGVSVGDQVKAMVATIREQTKYAGNDPAQQAAMYNGGFPALNALKSGNTAAMPAETTQYLKKVGVNMGTNTLQSLSGTSIPEAALSRMTEAGNTFEQSMQRIMAALSANTAETTAAADNAARDTITAGTNTATATLAGARNVISQMEQRQKILTIMGVDINDPNSEISQYRRDSVAAQEEMRAIAPELQKLKSVAITDGPVEWLLAQVQLQGVSQKYNVAATKFNQASALGGQLQQEADRQLTRQSGVSTDAVQLQAKAQADAAEAKARVDAFGITQLARNAVASSYATELRFGEVVFQNSKDMARVMAEKWSLRETDVKDAKLAADVEQINVYRTMLGADRITAEEYRTADVKTRTKWLKDANGSSLEIASTPGESMLQLHEYKSKTAFARDMAPQAATFFRDLHNIGVNGKDDKKSGGLPKYRGMSDEQLYAASINEKYERWQEEAQAGNMAKDNPYAMNASIYAQSPALKGSAIAQYVLSNPGQGAGLDDKAVLLYARELALTGKRPVSEITAELTKFYWEGSKFQDQTLRMSLLGFDRRDSKYGVISYLVDRNIFGFWDRAITPGKANPDKTFNMYNTVSLENFLTLQVAKAKALAVTPSARNNITGFLGSQHDPARNISGADN